MKRLPAVHCVADCRLPTQWGIFRMYGYVGEGSDEAYCLEIGEPSACPAPLVRLHSACLTGESLHSLRCDCREQLDSALRQMAGEGAGLLVYLCQEGRGIGLMNKLRAYALQDDGLDTVDANLQLGLPVDGRDYRLAAAIVRARRLTAIRLLTNNPDKCAAIEAAGIRIVARVPSCVPIRPENHSYLQTKALRLGHLSIPASR